MSCKLCLKAPALIALFIGLVMVSQAGINGPPGTDSGIFQEWLAGRPGGDSAVYLTGGLEGLENSWAVAAAMVDTLADGFQASGAVLTGLKVEAWAALPPATTVTGGPESKNIGAVTMEAASALAQRLALSLANQEGAGLQRLESSGSSIPDKSAGPDPAVPLTGSWKLEAHLQQFQGGIGLPGRQDAAAGSHVIDQDAPGRVSVSRSVTIRSQEAEFPPVLSAAYLYLTFSKAVGGVEALPAIPEEDGSQSSDESPAGGLPAGWTARQSSLSALMQEAAIQGRRLLAAYRDVGLNPRLSATFRGYLPAGPEATGEPEVLLRRVFEVVGAETGAAFQDGRGLVTLVGYTARIPAYLPGGQPLSPDSRPTPVAGAGHAATPGTAAGPAFAEVSSDMLQQRLNLAAAIRNNYSEGRAYFYLASPLLGGEY